MAQLTPNERDFLMRSVRVDDDAERMRLYRECGCAHADKADGIVKGAITKLLKRADAQVLLAREEMRASMATRDALQEADRVRGKAIIDDAEALVVAKEALVLAILTEADALKANPDKSASGLAKMVEVLAKVADGGDGGEQMTAAEAKEAMRMLAEAHGAGAAVAGGGADEPSGVDKQIIERVRLDEVEPLAKA